MILDNWWALEADFRRCYGVRDLFEELKALSWEAFESLVSGLPEDAAFWRSLRMPARPATAEQLVALIGRGD